MVYKILIDKKILYISSFQISKDEKGDNNKYRKYTSSLAKRS